MGQSGGLFWALGWREQKERERESVTGGRAGCRFSLSLPPFSQSTHQVVQRRLPALCQQAGHHLLPMPPVAARQRGAAGVARGRTGRGGGGGSAG